MKQPTSFAKDTALVAGGNIAAQAIALAGGLLLARLVDPAAFGLLEIAVAGATIFVVAALMSYDLAVVADASDETARRAITLSLLLAAAGGALVLSVLRLRPDLLPADIAATERAAAQWLIPALFVAEGVQRTFKFAQTRVGRFGDLARANIINAVLTLGARLALLFATGIAGASLIAGSVFGTACAVAYIGVSLYRAQHGALLRPTRLRTAVATAFALRRYSLLSGPGNLAFTLALYTPSLLLGHYFGATVLGLYALGERLFRRQMNAFAQAITPVFFNRISRTRDPVALAAMVGMLRHAILQFGMAPTLIVLADGPTVFRALLGPEWSDAGLYTAILAVPVLLQTLVQPLARLLYVLDRQDLQLKFSLLLLAGRVGALVYGGRRGDIVLTLALMAAVSVVVFCAQGYATGRLIGIPVGAWLRAMAANLWLPLLFLAPVAAARRFWDWTDAIAFAVYTLATVTLYVALAQQYPGVRARLRGLYARRNSRM